MARKSRKNQILIQPISKVDGDTALESLVEYVPKKKKNALRTAAYVRLSVENNGHMDDDSLQTQVMLVESFVRNHEDQNLTETYIDNGYSGTKFDRPEFVRMMEGVKNGQIQCIVVKDLSRFGRDYLETGYYLETIFPLLNVRFIAITDNFDSIREEDRNSLSVPIKNMVNAMYAKDYSRKQEVFREMCKRTGRVMGINAPYGYKFNPENKKLEMDEEVAPYVRMIFAWSLAGVKRSEIANRLNLMGAITPGEHDGRNVSPLWRADSVRVITYNPVYAGFHVMGKSKVSAYKGIKPMRYNRKEWLYFPNFHEPYITMEDYAQIEKIIDYYKAEKDERMRVREEDRKKLPDYFPRMVYCADCGRIMGFYRGCHHRGYNELSFQYYRCKYSKAFAKCNNKKIQQNFLKVVVMDQIRNLIHVACDRNQIMKEIQSGSIKTKTLDMMQRTIARMEEKEQMLDNKIIKCYEDFAERLLDEREYYFIKEKLIRDKQEVEEKRKECEQKLYRMEKSVHQFQQFAEHLEEYLDVSEFNEKLVQELVSKIYVSDDGSVEIEFKCQDIFEEALIQEYLGEE